MRRLRSRRRCCTCWSATSWSRNCSASPVWSGTSPRDAPFPVVGDVTEADRGARALRSHWGLGIDPIPDLVEILEGRGVKVLSVTLAESIDGLTARVRRAHGNAVPVIVVNNAHWGERQRFTIAHELGHMVLDVIGRNVDGEKAAHRFAGALLMPAEALWSEVGKRRTSIGWDELFKLKQLFGVSVQALTYRCKELGIFTRPPLPAVVRRVQAARVA